MTGFRAILGHSCVFREGNRQTADLCNKYQLVYPSAYNDYAGTLCTTLLSFNKFSPNDLLIIINTNGLMKLTEANVNEICI